MFRFRESWPHRLKRLKNPLRWWQLLTAGFAHSDEDIWHILGNMLSLFFLGRIVEFKYGGKKYLGFFLTAILLGNLGFALRCLISGSPATCIGASGGVVATVVVFALSFPREIVRLWGIVAIPAWVLGAFIVLMDIVGSFNSDSRTAHDVHLIGAAYGFLFFRTGWEITAGLPKNLFGSLNRNLKRRPKVRRYDPEKKFQQLDAQADAILEKLHREGESSLNSKERKILEEYSRRVKEKNRNL